MEEKIENQKNEEESSYITLDELFMFPYIT